MEVMILTFVVLMILIIGMSVGVLMGRKPIAGSCGGMAALQMDTACTICGGNPQKCEEEQERQRTADVEADLSYEVKAKG
ncbi:(Na+)-NQR maturation NqrM [Marinobacterium arenosum]|uniref:(Na+)-NQR maturation NqrM n=1 Tax=Marinobacterium arenosum TaxID=2862496 RepID=UPI001C96B880|nr:(Na+)-NQR maturation NqrM [Marinobacterium arenosum]MBY4677276.1 (Na+)-NQR maturation NqrM [Marinobacterium arenosum]